MVHNTVRRIDGQRYSGSDEPWVRAAKKIQRSRTLQSPSRPVDFRLRLAFWGSRACIMGGTLWILILGCRYLLSYHYLLPLPVDSRVLSTLPLHEGTFVVSILLMLGGGLGLYAMYGGSVGVWGRISLVISFLGLAVAVCQNFYDYWLGQRWGGVIIDFYLEFWTIPWWFDSAEWGLFVFSLGFTLFAIFGFRRKGFRSDSLLFLAASAMPLFICTLIYRFLLTDLDYGSTDMAPIALVFGGFTALLALFGASWIGLGIILLRTGHDLQILKEAALRPRE
jgi:hypothetical protein